MSFRFSAMACVCLTSLAFSANAALVRVDFKGSNSSPSLANVFGEAVPSIEGFLVYEDSLPGVNFSTFNGLTRNYASAIREVSFSLGDVFSGARAGNFGSVQVRDGAGALSDRLSFNNMILSPSQVEGEPVGLLTASLTLGLSSKGPALASADLPGLFMPSIFDDANNIEIFLSRPRPVGEQASAVRFNFNLTEVRVSDPNAVPEPASLALMGLALAGVAAVRRRRPA